MIARGGVTSPPDGVPMREAVFLTACFYCVFVLFYPGFIAFVRVFIRVFMVVGFYFFMVFIFYGGGGNLS